MWNCIDLVLASTLLWLYFQTAFIFLINIFYLTMPSLVWGAIIVYILIRFGIRLPSPNLDVVKKVLGVDPLSYIQNGNDFFNKKYTENNKEYCMRVIAHRGAGYDYPENSMSAFRYSHKKGCDAIEFDLSLTKDNIAIVFHDFTIDRITGLNGNIKDMTWNELKDFDISANHPLRSKFTPEGEKIALFEEVLKEALQNDQHMFIDIKVKSNEIVKIILDAFKKYPQLYEKAVITSFNPIPIYMIRRKDPCIVAGMSWRPRIFSMNNYNGLDGPNQPRYDTLLNHIVAVIIDIIHKWALEHITYYILGLSCILLHKDVISAESIRLWNKRGIRIIAWTVNLPNEKVHFTKNLKISYLTDTLLS